MLDFLQGLFQKKVDYKSRIPFSDAELAKYLAANRHSLQQVTTWIDEEAMARSYFKYGVPDFIRGDINKPVGDPPTYTDVMALIAEKYLGGDVNYLEIGVSVGKNFFQVLN